nr:transposase [Devosia limi]
MGKANFTEEFKRDAVRQITERDYPLSEVSQRRRVSAHSLSTWRRPPAT